MNPVSTNDMQIASQPPRPPPLLPSKVNPIWNWVFGPKKCLCSETYEKTIFLFLFIWDIVDFVLKFLEKFGQIFVNMI